MSGSRSRWPTANIGPALFFLLLLVTACGRQERAAPEKVLRIPITEAITTLDPVKTITAGAAQVSNQIFDRLVEIDDNLNLRPAIAEGWETPDGKTWIFTIRKGIRFHDDPAFPNGKGREVTAYDVEYSIKRLLDPKSKTTVAWLLKSYILGGEEFSSGKAETLKGVEVLDERRIKFTLTRPYSPFPYRLAIFAAGIVPREAVERYGEDFGRHPVGTGPFVFKRWIPDAEIELVRNPAYWEKGLPKVDRLRFVLLRDEMVAFLNFGKGELDLVNVPAPAVSSVVDEEGKLRPEYAKYTLLRGMLARTEYYAFLLTAKPWGENKLLRQALNYGINREEIVKFILKGRGVPATQMIPPIIWGYSPDGGYRYDPERAKALLAQAGFPGGKGLEPLRLVVDAGVETERVAVAVQDQLRRLGVNVQIEVVQFPQLVDLAFKGQAPLFRLYFSAVYPHPENFLFQFLEENTAPKGNNFFRYANPAFEKLYFEATSVAGREKTEGLYRQMSKLIIEDAPALFLYHPEQWVLTQPYVKGLKLNGLEFMSFEKVGLER